LGGCWEADGCLQRWEPAHHQIPPNGPWREGGWKKAKRPCLEEWSSDGTDRFGPAHKKTAHRKATASSSGATLALRTLRGGGKGAMAQRPRKAPAPNPCGRERGFRNESETSRPKGQKRSKAVSYTLERVFRHASCLPSGGDPKQAKGGGDGFFLERASEGELPLRKKAKESDRRPGTRARILMEGRRRPERSISKPVSIQVTSGTAAAEKANH